MNDTSIAVIATDNKITHRNVYVRETPLIDEYTVSKLHELLDYDPSTGVFKYRPRAGNAHFNRLYAGKVAGRLKLGYLYIKLLGKEVLGHQIAWKMIHGDYKGKIDHINRVPNDCRICNLRLTMGNENNWNRGQSGNNTSGVTGVSKTNDGRRWEAVITKNGAKHYLGRFKSLVAATAVRRQAEWDMYGSFAPLR